MVCSTPPAVIYCLHHSWMRAVLVSLFQCGGSIHEFISLLRKFDLISFCLRANLCDGICLIMRYQLILCCHSLQDRSVIFDIRVAIIHMATVSHGDTVSGWWGKRCSPPVALVSVGGLQPARSHARIGARRKKQHPQPLPTLRIDRTVCPAL